MGRGTPRVESEPTVQDALSGESADHISRRSENMERQLPLSSSSPRRVVEIGVHSSEEFGSHNEEGHGSEL